jgi:hypothetical protein
VEYFRRKEKETASCDVKLTVDSEIESELTTVVSDHPKEHWVPYYSPCPVGFRVRGQTVAQQVEADISVFATNWIVESVAEVTNARQSANRLLELLVLSSAAARPLINDAKLA